MRKLAATACLALLLFGCGENGLHTEATWEGRSTSQWVQLAKDDDVEARRKAVTALGELGLTEASDTVPTLTEAVADPDPAVRLLALRSLEKLAPKASKAQPAVGKAINDKNKTIAKQAMKTLRAIEVAKPSPLNGH
jgi:HEAT repeat protein